MKKIILTTMSILEETKRGTPNYYYDEASGKYCEGIAQTEAGTKLFLSGDETIDEIVAIGSDDTYDSAGVSDSTDNCSNEIEKIVLKYWFATNKNNDFVDASPYAFYRSRIGAFCFNNKISSNDNERAEELKKLIEKFMKDKRYCKPSEWFDIIAADERKNKGKSGQESLIGKLKLSVKENFKNSGVADTDIQRHFISDMQYIKEHLFCLLDNDKKLKANENISNLQIRFVPERITLENGETYDNIAGILDAIRGIENEDIELYVDMQGGNRTDGYVRNAIMSILTGDAKANFNIKKVVATNFATTNFANAIVDETERYQITDLVSAMNAFTQYGKADLIKKYCDRKYPSDAHIGNLVDQMQNIDMALSTCNIDAFTTALRECHVIFNKQSDDGLFGLVENLIRNEYEGILNKKGEVDYVGMTEWAVKKGFIQQALTIIEAKFPAEIVKRGICYYDYDGAKDYFEEEYKKQHRKTYEFSDLSHFYISNGACLNLRKTLLVKLENCKQLLDAYKDVRGDRNSINHSAGNSEEVSKTYESYKKHIGKFLNIYKICLQDVRSKQNDEIKLWKSDELNLVKPKNKKKKKAAANTAAQSVQREFKSRMPADNVDCLKTLILGDLKKYQVDRIMEDCGLTDDQYYYIKRKKDFDKIEYYASSQNQEESKKLIEEVLSEVHSFTGTDNNLLIVADESFAKLCGREVFDEMTRYAQGVLVIARDFQKCWRMVENL